MKKRYIFFSFLLIALMCFSFSQSTKVMLSDKTKITLASGTKMTLDDRPEIVLVTDQTPQDQVGITLAGTGTCTIDWGDDNSDTVSGAEAEYTHNYGSTGDFKIRIYGDLGQLTKLYISDGAGTISGNIATLKYCTALTYLYLSSTSVTGDISSVSGLTALTHLYLSGTSVSDYTSTTLPDWEGTNIHIQDLGLSEQEVDDFLCDLDTATGDPGNGTLDISGTNAPPSATGLTCETSLEDKNWAVTVTGE